MDHQQTPKKTQSYCEFVRGLDVSNLHRIYHDTQYGLPVEDDEALFELLVMEINQAGLSWNTILAKRDNLKKAFDQYNIETISKYGEREKERLLNDAGIIRNRLKIESVIHNANVVIELQKTYGSFFNWLNHHHPLTLEAWTHLFRSTFRFTGKEIVNEFLMSSGFLPGAHTIDCPIYTRVMAARPPFLRKSDER